MGLVWDTNMGAVLLFWNTNMASVTSCENALFAGWQNKTNGSKKNVLDETENYCYRLFSFLFFCCFCFILFVCFF